MQTSLRKISKRVVEEPRKRITGLYSLLNERNLHWCYSRLKRKAKPGVDGVDWKDYGKDLAANIGDLVGRLIRKAYKARLILRMYIPKSNGKQRPLGLPATEDKLVQYGCSKMLEAIYEHEFEECSFAYRPGRGAIDAKKYLRTHLQRGTYRWILDCDIKGFFENINHKKMIMLLELKIHDQAFMRLLLKWLKAGILEKDGSRISPYTGCPQGGTISPVLSNVYLHYALDRWFLTRVRPWCKGDSLLVRYADDFVCAFQYYEDAQKFQQWLRVRLARFSLELSEEKTRLLQFDRSEIRESKSFNFLGFEYRWSEHKMGNYLYVATQTSSKKQRESLKSFFQWIKENRHMRNGKLFERLKEKLRGYYNYYGVAGNSRRLHAFYRHVEGMLFMWLNRRSQRRSCNWKKFRKLLRIYGVPTPRIRKIESEVVTLAFS